MSEIKLYFKDPEDVGGRSELVSKPFTQEGEQILDIDSGFEGCAGCSLNYNNNPNRCAPLVYVRGLKSEEMQNNTIGSDAHQFVVVVNRGYLEADGCKLIDVDSKDTRKIG